MGPTLESRVSPVPWAVAVFLVWAAAGSCVDRRGSLARGSSHTFNYISERLYNL